MHAGYIPANPHSPSVPQFESTLIIALPWVERHEVHSPSLAIDDKNAIESSARASKSSGHAGFINRYNSQIDIVFRPRKIVTRFTPTQPDIILRLHHAVPKIHYPPPIYSAQDDSDSPRDPDTITNRKPPQTMELVSHLGLPLPQVIGRIQENEARFIPPLRDQRWFRPPRV